MPSTAITKKDWQKADEYVADFIESESDDTKLLFWLICFFSSSAYNVDKRVPELIQPANTTLKRFKFTKEEGRLTHRRNLKDFIVKISRYSEEIFRDKLNKNALHKNLNPFKKLGANGVGYDSLKLGFCISAGLNKHSLKDHVVQFIIEFPKHELWSQNNPNLTTAIKKLLAKEVDEDTKEVIEKHEQIRLKSAHCETLRALISTPEYENTEGDEVSLSPLNHNSIKLHGRQQELTKLDDFLNDPQPFQIMFVIAPSGAGKTRLVTQWLHEHVNKQKWQAGLVQEECTDIEWRQWAAKPIQCDTLIIIDYIYRFKDIVRRIIKTGAAQSENRPEDNNPPKLRLIILDHVLPDLQDFDRSDPNQQTTSEHGERRLLYSHHSPIYLSQQNADIHKEMLKAIIADAYGDQSDTDNIDLAFESLRRIDEQDNDDHDTKKVRFASFPLFAILIGHALKKSKARNEVINLKSWQRKDLMSFYFSSENRIPWDTNSNSNLEDEINQNGTWVGVAVAAATVVQGLPFRLLAKEIRVTGSRENMIRDACNYIVSSQDRITLKKYEPDIIGETFVLKFFEQFRWQSQVTTRFYKLLSAAGEQPNEKDVSNNRFIEFVQRTARNLSNDNQNNIATQEAWEVLAAFLDSTKFPESTSLHYAANIAIIRVSDILIEKQLFHLNSLFLENISENVFFTDCDQTPSIDAAHAFIKYYDRCGEWKRNEQVFRDKLIELDTHTEQQNPTECSVMEWAIRLECVNVSKSILGTTYFKKTINSSLNLFRGYFIDDTKYSSLDILIREFGEHAENNKTKLPFDNKFTALMLACCIGNTEIVSLLIANGAAIDLGDRGEWTPLMFASYRNHTQVAAVLINNKANLDVANEGGYTALMIACQEGNLEMLNLLADEEAQLDLRNKQLRTALMLAVRYGHAKIVSVLIDKKAKLDLISYAGQSSLIQAVISDNTNIARLLIEGGANLDIQNEWGFSALMFAIKENNTEIAVLLVDWGADIDLADEDKQTALMLASYEGNTAVVTKLVAINSNLNSANSNHQTALMIASSYGYAALPTDLTNCRLDDKWTGNVLYGNHGHSEIARLLIEKNVELNATDDNKMTALMLACECGHAAVVSLLIEKADLNVKDNRGRTALTIASNGGYSPVVSLLIEEGLNLDLDNSDYWVIQRSCSLVLMVMQP